jgi:hypothetical protein
MTRAARRHHEQRLKAKALRRARDEMGSRDMPRGWAGKTVAVHWTCDCGMCALERMHADRDRDQRLALLWKLAELY